MHLSVSSFRLLFLSFAISLCNNKEVGLWSHHRVGFLRRTPRICGPCSHFHHGTDSTVDTLYEGMLIYDLSALYSVSKYLIFLREPGLEGF